MKRLILLLIILAACAAHAEVKTYYWIHPTGGMLRTVTGNQKHIARIEEQMIEFAELADPEDAKSLPLPLVVNAKTVDAETLKSTGDGFSYTRLTRKLDFKRAVKIKPVVTKELIEVK